MRTSRKHINFSSHTITFSPPRPSEQPNKLPEDNSKNTNQTTDPGLTRFYARKKFCFDMFYGQIIHDVIVMEGIIAKINSSPLCWNTLKESTLNGTKKLIVSAMNTVETQSDLFVEQLWCFIEQRDEP